MDIFPHLLLQLRQSPGKIEKLGVDLISLEGRHDFMAPKYLKMIIIIILKMMLGVYT